MPVQRLVPFQAQQTFADSCHRLLIFWMCELFQFELAERLIPRAALVVKHGKIVVHAGGGRRSSDERLVLSNGLFMAPLRSKNLRMQPPHPN